MARRTLPRRTTLIESTIGVEREHALDALAVGDLAHREALVEAVTAARNAHALIGLNARTLAFRDLHRHAREKAFADELTGRRPDAVLVEMGVPVSRPAGARAYLATHGASRVSAVL